MADTMPSLNFPASSQSCLEPYLPPGTSPPSFANHDGTTPFLTLTFAQSLDGAISLSPGVQTALSGPETKAMTHFLRSKHDAIIVGAGTAIADDPSLNCRLEGAKLEDQPRPVVIDPDHRWNVVNSKVWQLAKQGLNHVPIVIVSRNVEQEWNQAMVDNDALYVVMPRDVVATQSGAKAEIPWVHILKMLRNRGHQSVMVEGGASVINTLLRPNNLHLVDSVIVTIAPTWLGQGSVTVSPDRRYEDGEIRSALRLRDTNWHQFGEDVVMCGRVDRDSIL